jgi:hypothetical protein
MFLRSRARKGTFLDAGTAGGFEEALKDVDITPRQGAGFISKIIPVSTV